jgi:hypothetical protein
MNTAVKSDACCVGTQALARPRSLADQFNGLHYDCLVSSAAAAFAEAVKLQALAPDAVVAGTMRPFSSKPSSEHAHQAPR